jgi:putative SOS response-associated peptidase YedK
LILADGFYEWQVVHGRKQPMRFTLAGDEPFAFAGLWTVWNAKATGEIIESAPIITTRANELVAPVHDRMPVILPPQAEELWLDDAAARRARDRGRGTLANRL